MKIEAQFTYDKVKHDQENEVHLVVSLKAPKTDWETKRPAVCIIPVVDCSSSMSGEKLDFARRSVDKLVEHLKPGDFCGLVTFDDTVTTISKPMEMTQTKKDQLRTKIATVQSSGCTNFSGGMCEGLEHANKGDFPEGMLVRVIMFTDGQANRGIATTRDQLLPLLDKSLGTATLSAFGYGHDAEQELLADLAKKGKGNYAFIKNPDDALSAFAKELGGLLSTYAQNITIEVAPHNGHRIDEVISDVDVEQKDKNVIIKLPEIFAEEERHLVIALKLSEQTQALPRAMNVADINVAYERLDEGGKRSKQTEEVKAKISFVKDGDQQDKPTPEVDRLVGLAQLVKSQVEAESFAKKGDYNAAEQVMARTEKRLHTRGLMPQAAAARGMRSKVASSMAYASSEGYRNSFKGGVTRGVGTSGMDEEAFVQMSAMGVDYSNAAQDCMVASFTGDDKASIKVDAGGAIHLSTPSAQVHVSAPTPPSKKVEKKDKSLSKSRSKRW